MAAGIGDHFQRGTVYFRQKRHDGSLDWSRKPHTYKKYESKRTIPLSHYFPDQTLPFLDVLKKRRSVRSFSSEPLLVEDVSFLLWASTGIQRRERGYEFRTVPSAGALYPIETYLVVNNVVGLEKGVYHYNIREHVLEELTVGDFAEETARAALDQEMCIDASVIFIWTAVFERSKWKYKQRAYRYIYLDAGHIAQNLALCATSIGLGSCQIGALYDEEVNRIVKVDGIEESTLYLSVVGHPI